MRMHRLLGALGLAGLVGSGCEPPPYQTVPITPPGIEHKTELPKEATDTQALGEAGNEVLAAGGTAAELAKKAEAKETRTLETRTTPSGLKVEVLRRGTGPMAQSGQTVTVHVTESLPNGRIVSNSREKGSPVTFVLGNGDVLSGLDEGVTGMRVGERRKLTLPAGLAYGEVGLPPTVAPGATVLEDVELIDIRNVPKPRSTPIPVRRP